MRVMRTLYTVFTGFLFAALSIWGGVAHAQESQIRETQIALDRTGTKIADYQFDEQAPASWTTEGVEDIWDIQWTGGEKTLLAAKERHERGDTGVYDALNPSDFSVQLDTETDRLYAADVTGDWREELLVISGAQLHIYRNTAQNPRPDRERLWEERMYRLDRTTWNYYSP